MRIMSPLGRERLFRLARGIVQIMLRLRKVFFRFQTKLMNTDSGRPTGILVAAHHLRDSNEISMVDEKWLREQLVYFNTHLKIPTFGAGEMTYRLKRFEFSGNFDS